MEAAAYEEAIESGELVEKPQVPEQPLSPAERTSDYVQKLSQVCLEDIPVKVEQPEHFRKASEYSEIPKVDIQHSWQPAGHVHIKNRSYLKRHTNGSGILPKMVAISCKDRKRVSTGPFNWV